MSNIFRSAHGARRSLGLGRCLSDSMTGSLFRAKSLSLLFQVLSEPSLLCVCVGAETRPRALSALLNTRSIPGGLREGLGGAAPRSRRPR